MRSMQMLSRRIGLLLALLLLTSTAIAAAPATATKAPKLVVSVDTDRPEAIYKLGEEVQFRVQVKQGSKPVTQGKVSYTLDDEGPNRVAAGSIKLGEGPTVIAGKLSKPGFLRCRVSVQLPGEKPVQALAAAAVSPEKIEPSLPVPDDFDQFWAAQKAELAKVPMKPVLTPVDSPAADIECFDVQIPCAGGAPVSGYFARPKDARPGSLPALLSVHGAGVRTSILGTAVSGAGNGFLAMDINAHGIPNGKPAEYYSDLAKGALADYRHRGRESRDTCYFRGMYLRLVRAIDFLTAQPQWNGKVLVVTGHSQGGGQSLVAAGIDDRVTFIAAGVPAMCDHTGVAAGRVNGWPKIVPNGPDGRPDPKVLQAARYFDAVNFATRTKADAIMSTGFVDGTCPATTNYAAYNQLTGAKQMINKPKMGHAAPSDVRDAFLEAIKKHAAAAK